MPDQLPLLVQHMLGLYAVDMLAVGEASGALTVLEQGPGTASEIAERAGLDQRNVDQWLRAVTASGHVHHDGGTFTLDQQTAFMLGPEFPVDMHAVLRFVHATFGEPFRASSEAMRTGAGVASDVFAEIAAASGAINTRTYETELVGDWIAAAPGLAERLAEGGRIADLACGNGDAAAVMATAFTGARVFGYDPGTPEGAHAGVANLEIVRESAGLLPADGSFDLVTCLDAFHHLGDPAAAAKQAYAALADGGVLLVAEASLSGDLDTDSADPTSLITHAAGLLYCMQESIANGGDGLTPSLGLAWVDDALAAAGFRSVEHHESPSGYRVFLATR